MLLLGLHGSSIRVKGSLPSFLKQVLRDCSSHTTFELISKFLRALECAMLQPTSPLKTMVIFWYEELLPVLEWPEISICKSIFVLYLLLCRRKDIQTALPQLLHLSWPGMTVCGYRHCGGRSQYLYK